MYINTDKKDFLSNQCKEIEDNNRIGKTRDLFKKIRDTKRGLISLQSLYILLKNILMEECMIKQSSIVVLFSGISRNIKLEKLLAKEEEGSFGLVGIYLCVFIH